MTWGNSKVGQETRTNKQKGYHFQKQGAGEASPASPTRGPVVSTGCDHQEGVRAGWGGGGGREGGM